MKKILGIALLLSIGMPVTWAATSSLPVTQASAAADMAKAEGCLTCHSMDEKIVGPAYVKVAAKYKGDADAVASLMQSVRNGSQGKWGRAPMPPHPNLKDDDLRTLVRWVLSLQP